MHPILSVNTVDTKGGGNKEVTRGEIEQRQDLPHSVKGSANGSPVEAETPKHNVAVSEDKVSSVAEYLKKYVQDAMNRELDISIDKGSGEPVIKIVDRTTQEVIRQYPPQEILDLAQRMRSGTDAGALLKVSV